MHGCKIFHESPQLTFHIGFVHWEKKKLYIRNYCRKWSRLWSKDLSYRNERLIILFVIWICRTQRFSSGFSLWGEYYLPEQFTVFYFSFRRSEFEDWNSTFDVESKLKKLDMLGHRQVEHVMNERNVSFYSLRWFIYGELLSCKIEGKSMEQINTQIIQRHTFISLQEQAWGN